MSEKLERIAFLTASTVVTTGGIWLIVGIVWFIDWVIKPGINQTAC